LETAAPVGASLAPPVIDATPPRPPVLTGLFARLDPASPAPARPRPPATSSAFGTASAGPATPARQRAAAAAAGFGSAVATPAGARAGQVRSGGFDPAAPPPPQAPSRREAARVTSPVEILEKPRPAYSEEARRLRLEGEVILRVRFAASGAVEVVSVVQGLGHGLDEQAVTAARRIRFRPALAGGEPIDAEADVHMVFQLAY
jgi:TonB family protein